MELKEIYSINKIRSTVQTSVDWKGMDIAFKDFQNGWAILWQHHGVFVGKIENSNVTWLNSEKKVENSDEHIVRLRIFNTEREMHLWKSGNLLKGRLRIDDRGGDINTECIDTPMRLRGVVSKQLFKELNTIEDNNIFIKTRNYIAYNAIGQAGYVDCRFVDFKVI